MRKLLLGHFSQQTSTCSNHTSYWITLLLKRFFVLLKYRFKLNSMNWVIEYLDLRMNKGTYGEVCNLAWKEVKNTYISWFRSWVLNMLNKKGLLWRRRNQKLESMCFKWPTNGNSEVWKMWLVPQNQEFTSKR